MKMATDTALEPIVTELPLQGRRELFITVNGGDAVEMQSLLDKEAAKRGAKILERFAFAGTKLFKGFQRSASRPEQGLTWLQGDACKDGEATALQAFAIADAGAKPLHVKGRLMGYVYEDSFARYCRLCGVAPSNPNAPKKEQTIEVFESVDMALAEAGFKFTDTVRTWLYLDNLLTWYKEFNEARTAYFEKTGIFGKMVPASTGIGAANQSGGALSCGLYAVQPKDGRVKIQAVESPLQGSAMSYRSSFSRAVEIASPAWRQLMISGTASIDKAGASIHIGDPAKQIETTMRVLEALLDSRGMSWQDVSRGIAYFKSMDFVPLFERHCAERGLPKLPFAIAHTDVCRDELLFEIELDAVKLS